MLGVLWWTGGMLGIFLSRNGQVLLLSFVSSPMLNRHFAEKYRASIDVRIGTTFLVVHAVIRSGSTALCLQGGPCLTMSKHSCCQPK